MEVSTVENINLNNNTGQLMNNDDKKKSPPISTPKSISVSQNLHANNVNKNPVTLANNNNTNNGNNKLSIVEPDTNESRVPELDRETEKLCNSSNQSDEDIEVKNAVEKILQLVIESERSEAQLSKSSTDLVGQFKDDATTYATIEKALPTCRNNLEDEFIEAKNQREFIEIETSEVDDKTKDIVTLRNLEITPPPIIDENDQKDDINSSNKDIGSIETLESSSKKRKTNTPELKNQPKGNLNDSLESSGRTKRQRTQTKLFQVGATPSAEGSTTSSNISTRSRDSSVAPRERKKSVTSSAFEENLTTAHTSLLHYQQSHDPQDVILYEKNDYLALRNETDGFYLCQLTANVRAQCPEIKVKWLDTNDNGKTYFLTFQYDKVPQQSILMPVSLDKMNNKKKEKQLYTLNEQDREMIMERLKRSLNATVNNADSSQETIIEN